MFNTIREKERERVKTDFDNVTWLMVGDKLMLYRSLITIFIIRSDRTQIINYTFWLHFESFSAITIKSKRSRNLGLEISE